MWYKIIYHNLWYTKVTLKSRMLLPYYNHHLQKVFKTYWAEGKVSEFQDKMSL